MFLSIVKVGDTSTKQHLKTKNLYKTSDNVDLFLTNKFKKGVFKTPSTTFFKMPIRVRTIIIEKASDHKP